MVRGVQERVANHLVARLFERQLSPREEAPPGLEMRVAGLLQRLACLGNCLVECRNELRSWARYRARPS